MITLPDFLHTTTPLAAIACRFLIDLIAVFLLARVVYYSLHKRSEYLFTFFLFNVLIFLICVLLSSARLQVGFAFGLFAVFSMIRYRTVTIPVKEMGYFFVCVALGLINALASDEHYYLLPIASSIVIVVLVLALDIYVGLRGEQMMELTYERVDLVVPAQRDTLLQDLRARTGLPVQRVVVVSFDFLRDVAVIQIFYPTKKGHNA